MGDAASLDVVTLGKQLVSGTAAERADAAERLSRAGEEAAAAAVPLVQACGDGDERIREWAVAALEGWTTCRRRRRCPVSATPRPGNGSQRVRTPV